MTSKEALKRLKQPFSATPDTDSYFDAKEVAIKSLEKDLSIVDELEKIKSEISKLTRYYTTESGKINLVSDNAVYRIINKHISELKGENK